MVSGTLTTTYVYNGDGHRVASAVNGVTTTYVVVVLGLPQVIVESTGGHTTRYLYGHDLLAEYDGAAWAYHLDDGLGSVRQLADDDGHLTLAQGYAPFGEPLWSKGTGPTGYGFTGEQWDAEAGLLFLRARYYEPASGVFATKDTWTGDFTKPMSFHGWLYVYANPTNLTDPTGLDPRCGKAGMTNETCAKLRMAEIIRAANGNSAEALYRMFEDSELYSLWGSAAGRMCSARFLWVLDQTRGFWFLHQKSLGDSDKGFCFQFQDSTLYGQYWTKGQSKTNQAGHFLTAADIGYNQIAVSYIIGHEQLSDDPALKNWLHSAMADSPTDLKHWWHAVEYDELGWIAERDNELWTLLHFRNGVAFGDADEGRLGNSLQDLRLSVKGWRFGKWVRENKSLHPRFAGSWLRWNLATTGWVPLIIK